MPEFWQEHTREWRETFTRRGYRNVTPLAAGTEGAIYDLGDGTVAKVWGQRRAADLSLMQRLYADVASAGLPFATRDPGRGGRRRDSCHFRAQAARPAPARAPGH
jgi:hypothetical protein